MLPVEVGIPIWKLSQIHQWFHTATWKMVSMWTLPCEPWNHLTSTQKHDTNAETYRNKNILQFKQISKLLASSAVVSSSPWPLHPQLLWYPPSWDPSAPSEPRSESRGCKRPAGISGVYSIRENKKKTYPEIPCKARQQRKKTQQHRPKEDEDQLQSPRPGPTWRVVGSLKAKMLQPTTVDSDERPHRTVVSVPSRRRASCTRITLQFRQRRLTLWKHRFFGWIQTPETNEVGFNLF